MLPLAAVLLYLVTLLVKAMRDSCGPGKLLLAGSGCESTLETLRSLSSSLSLSWNIIIIIIRMTEAMAKAGCDAAVVVTPCYYKGVTQSNV